VFSPYPATEGKEVKHPAVYILASRRNGTLYIGVTSNLIKRVWHHRNVMAEGFTSRYTVHRLVYFEIHEDMNQAIAREKRLKEWKRAWKMRIIEEKNPDWIDLWNQIIR
jgi:putative endonuclease